MSELGKFGAPADLVAELSRGAKKETGDIEVLDGNWNAVQAWTRCQPTIIASMSGAIYVGISAVEIEMVCGILGAVLDVVLLDQIQHTARCADNIRNK